MLRSTCVLVAIVLLSVSVRAQSDSLAPVTLGGIEIIEQAENPSIGHLPEIQGTVINAGKKNERVILENTAADLSTNNARQVFAKVPGISVWESDGSGIQVGVASRGLSPNRSWEFNVRQNGYDISSDVFGYPEAYYNPPMEALESIELVRGASALQYGPQFGGLLNYVMKSGPADRKISLESRQTAGSYGLFNSYTALGGTIGKVSYYTYFHQRSADGWRENSAYRTHSGYASVQYRPSSKWKVGAEYTRMNYVSQQPGGLTDDQFREDPQQSFRSRNWMSTPWNVGAVTAEFIPGERTRFSLKAFTVIADRHSVGFTSAITQPDAIIDTLDTYANRQVDSDAYTNYGVEFRGLTKYSLFGQGHALSFGVRYYNGTTERHQRGIGTTGSDFDLTLVQPFGREYTFTTTNAAVFAENVFHIGERFLLIPGIRYEVIGNTAEGFYSASAGNFEDRSSERSVMLGGFGAEYHLGQGEFYANASTAFRPVTFSELAPSATTDVIDPNLKDAYGYNADLGYRGNWKGLLQLDAGLFYMFYDNRIGTIAQDGNNFRTNIGSSVTRGAEVFLEWNAVRTFVPRSSFGYIDLFVSASWIEARYTRWDDPAASDDSSNDRVGKRVENAPSYIHRGGVNYQNGPFELTWQVNMVGKAYADAMNTEEANATATNGLIPSYEVMDLTASLRLKEYIQLSAGVNNLTDESYFTRRAGGYPGPGILPANGRTVFVGVSVKL